MLSQKTISFIAALVLVAGVFQSDVQGQTIAQDCALARSIYIKMNGKSSTIPSATSCCGTNDILCSPTRIFLISWSSKGFTGPIPPEIGNLTGLTQLSLTMNKLNGSIPSTLGNLLQLTHLNLDFNELSGTIPIELTRLIGTQIKLSGNPGLASKQCILRQRDPQPDCPLIAINYKSLGGSVQIPSDAESNCCGWNNVQCSVFDKEPCWGSSSLGIWSTFRVTGINWMNQNLRGRISSNVANLTELNTLILRDNQITGSLPSAVGRMVQLSQLDLGNNRISGKVPGEIGNLRNLTRLSLTNNLFSEAIPSEIGSLRSLLSLELGKNQFTGTIPSAIQNLVSLNNLELNDNLLLGALPDGLSNLRSMLTLSLSGNTFSGLIPSTLGDLGNLTYLSLAQNQLSGSIPAQFGSLTKLEFLYLQENYLNGSVPSEIGRLTELRHLYMSNNFLSGFLPSQVGNLNQLMALRVETNNLTGVPASLSSLTQTKRVLLPNPMTLVPYDLVSRNPSFTLLDSDWLSYLSTTTLKKRQVLSNQATLTAEELYALCPLNDVRNPEVPAGCIAGIYNKFCVDINTEEKLRQCQSVYDQVFTASIFKPIGDVCPAWKRGPRSFDCVNTIRNFKYQLPYMLVTSQHAANLTSNILGSQNYAPCYNIGQITCRW